jgi:polyhydroxyalkanoate synthesis regulator phasin
MKHKSKKLEAHPLADLFPIIPAAELAELARDIKANGLQHPIVLFEGRVLDGRHRLDCCERVGVKPKFVTYKGDDAVGYVVSLNMRRRHLDAGQRAMIAAQIASMEHGGDRRSDKPTSRTTRAEAAAALNVSPASVSNAKQVLEKAPKLADKVKAGQISLNEAKTKMAEAEAAAEEVVDKTGFKVPPPLHSVWSLREVPVDLQRKVASLESTFATLQSDKHVLFAGFNFSEWISSTQRLKQAISKCVPYAVCPTCGGWNRAKCAHCKGVGFLSKARWVTDVPEEVKSIRGKQSKPTKQDQDQ